MMERKENERGAIMVEVLAVIALLGTMGTLLFRQVIQRNQELDNINIATEMRILKEGFLAYINADKAVLETDCQPIVEGGDPQSCSDSNQLRDNIRDFVPDGYADFHGAGDVLDMYNFYLYGYQVSGRKYFYGIIVPKTGPDGPLPEAMKLTQAARVANLIGSDGGIYTDDSSGGGYLNGTMGGWSLPCVDEVCPPSLPSGMTGIPVVLTGIDVYVPEPDIKDDARIPVAVPESIAFRRLHSSEYFSVGNSNDNCIEVCPDPTDSSKTVLCHTIMEGNAAKEDTIYGPGGLKSGAAVSNKCDPLFWVGTVTNTDTDKSSAGHVYIKNNLYVGRDNENERQAVAIETDNNSDAARQIRVYNIDGTERLTLNAAGHVIARASDGGETVRIDGGNGIITVYQKRSVGGNINKDIYIPTLRIGGGQIVSNEQATLADGKTRSYKLDLANVSLLNDVRLTSRGGAKLSEILPNYIAKNMHSLSFTESNSEEKTVEKPDCPKGYSRAIVVTPTKWAQYVQGVELNMEHKYNNNDQYNGTTFSNGATGTAHTHTFNVDAPDGHNINVNMINTDNNNIIVQDQDTDTQVRLIQKAPVQISITGNKEDPEWKVTMTYGGNKPSSKDGVDDISALVQTYCVFEKDAFSSGGTAASALDSGIYREQGSKPNRDTTLTPDASDQEDYVGNKEETATCSDDWDCLNTESCNSGKCELRGTCFQDDGVSTGIPHEYCIDGVKVYLCFDNDDCPSGKTCIYNKCVK